MLPHGTPDEVRAAVAACVRDLAPDGTGLLLAPSHRMMTDIPLANVAAMVDAFHQPGALPAIIISERSSTHGTQTFPPLVGSFESWEMAFPKFKAAGYAGIESGLPHRTTRRASVIC